MACRGRYGSFDFLMMPSGLGNAIATFTTFMDNALYEYLDDFVIFIDNILAYPKMVFEHAGHLEKVL